MQDMMHSRCYKMVPIFRSSKSEQELLKSRNWNIRWLSKGHSQILWHSWTLNRLPQEDLSCKMDPAFIQHSWILLVFTWTCLVAEEWEMISPFPYITCERDCENSSIWFFFSVLSFPKACRKNHHSKESPEEKVHALGHLSKPDSHRTHTFDDESLDCEYSQICLLSWPSAL